MSNEKGSLQKAADQVTEQQRSLAANSANELINDVFQNLVVGAKADTAKLPESIFVEQFLPFFSGEQNVKDRKEFFSEWIGVAGSPMGEVNVINEEGNVLFSVPPMFDSSVIETAKRNLGESFSDIYSQYKMHSNNLPVVGEKFLADAFEKKIGTTVKKSDVVSSNQERWNNILTRYGRKVGGVAGNPISVKTTNPGDDVEYD